MSNPLQLNCPACGGTLQAKDSSDQGKEVRCPKCHAIFNLELQDEDERDNSIRQTRVGAKPSRPRRSRWLVALLVLLVIGVAGSVAALFYKPRKSSASNTLDLTYLLPETDVVACLKVNELLGSPLLSTVIANPATEAMLTMAARQTGIAPMQIESVTLGVIVKQKPVSGLPALPIVPVPTRPRAVLVLRSTVPMDPEQIGAVSFKGTRVTYSGKTYYKLALPGGPPVDSCYFPTNYILVAALEADLKTIIDSGSTAANLPEFDFVRADQTFVVSATSDAFDLNPLSPPVTTGVNLQALESELKQNFQAGSFGIDVTNKIDLEVVLNCRDSSGASKVKSALDTNVADLKTLVAAQQNLLNLAGLTDVGQLAEKTLTSIDVTQSAQELKATATVPEDLKTLITKYSTGMNPFAMLGGGFPTGFPRPATPSGFSPPAPTPSKAAPAPPE